jgi:hypothetical protein
MLSLKLTMEPAAPPQFFGSPILRKGEFKPATDRPACFDRTVKSRWGIETRLNAAKSSTSGAVEEDAIKGVTDAAAHRGKPLALGLATYRRCEDRSNSSTGRARIAIKIGPVAITFDAKDVLTYLVIDPSRTADKITRNWEAAGRSNRAIRPIAISGAKTTVDPKVDASPVVDSYRQWWRKTWRPYDRRGLQTLCDVARLMSPRYMQTLDVVPVNLIKRAIALRIVGAMVARPIAG